MSSILSLLGVGSGALAGGGGGFALTPDTWYTNASGDWPIADLAVATWAPAVALNPATGKIHIIGGFNLAGASVLNTHQVFDPALNTVTTLAVRPLSLYQASAAWLNGKLYVFGGRTSGTTASAVVHEYDPGTDTWTTSGVTQLGSNKSEQGIYVIGDSAYLVGGYQSSGSSDTNVHWKYEPGASVVTLANFVHTVRSTSMSTNGTIAVAMGGQGGSSPISAANGNNSIYNVAGNSWSSGAVLPDPRTQMGSAYLGGLFHGCGGRNASFAYQGQLWKYNAGTNSWDTSGAAMPTNRAGHGCIARDGILYAIGGSIDHSASLATIVAYVPSGGGVRPY